MNNEQTPALREAVKNMANMREAYNNLSQAAEAYNTGKTELAANITAKGVQASAAETLPELAEKVSAISQETYEINGGEMYAKQLFGVANNDIVPGYWNLYDIMAQLLSDGRLANYGGILLAEYYKGYDSLALAGAGSGGAYVVSDKDEQGNFIMYTKDTTHTWNDDLNDKGNRWVAYCFAEESHEFVISNTDTSPRSIHIGRHVGTIRSVVKGRVSDVVVTDGNILDGFVGDFEQDWSKHLVIKNIKSAPRLYNPNSQSIYISADDISNSIDFNAKGASTSIILEHKRDDILISRVITAWQNNATNIPYLLIKGGKTASTIFVGNNNSINGIVILKDIEVMLPNNYGTALIRRAKKIYLMSLEKTSSILNESYLVSIPDILKYLYLGYKTNDRSLPINFRVEGTITDPAFYIELKNGYKKNCNISGLSSVLTAENIALYLLDKLADNTGEETLTLTIGPDNLNRILADETYAPYVASAQSKNWTIA